MKRTDVYNLIDGERYYQDHLPSTRTNGFNKTVGEYLTMLRHYMNKADAAWTDYAGDEAALDVVRKIAGICVHCMEDHGAPHRKQLFKTPKPKRKVGFSKHSNKTCQKSDTKL